MSQPPTYSIRTVEDFAKVPPDRRDICLQEFAVWLNMRDALAGLLEGIPGDTGSEFEWVDDHHHHHCAVVLTEGEEETILASGTIAFTAPELRWLADQLDKHNRTKKEQDA